MKISNTTPNYINQVYTNPKSSQTAGKKPVPPAEEGQTADSINLSNRTKDLQKVARALESEPVDRDKYVADIKERVENNQYNLNAEQIAEKMVSSLIDRII